MNLFKALDFSVIPAHAYHAALACGLPLAIWRHPGASEAQTVVAFGGDVGTGPVDFCDGNPGFVFSQFTNSPGQGFFIDADFCSYGKDGFVCNRDSNGRSTGGEFLDMLRQYRQRPVDAPHSWYESSGLPPAIVSTAEATFCEWVERVLERIRDGDLSKVVLSRVQECELALDFHPLALFRKLCTAYRTAFVSLVAIPGIGTWVGATPELLASLKDDTFTTVALAGTRPVAPESDKWSGTWHEKEIVEQAMVSEFIRDCFVAQGIFDFSETGTETARIGDLLHLQTGFTLRNASRYAGAELQRFLTALHPTPAVCGVPKAGALDYIASIEDHDRQFYAGYLGPVNLNRESQLFVNLRCLQMHGQSAVLYAGGGITVDSVPEREWLETELKLDALLRFLGPGRQSSIAGRDQAAELLCYD